MGPKFVGFTMYERIRKLTTRGRNKRYTHKIIDMFGSLGGEESRGEESSREKSRGGWLSSTLFECF